MRILAISLAALSLLLLAGCGSNPEAGEYAASEGAETSEGSGEASATQYGLEDTFDEVRAGARLRLSYAAATRTFVGTVTSTTGGLLERVRVEVHLSNGVELGPTPAVHLAASAIETIHLSAGDAPFETWTAHAEVG